MNSFLNSVKCFTEVCTGYELLQLIYLNVDLLTALATILQSEFYCRFHADNNCSIQQHDACSLPPCAVEHSRRIHVSRHAEWVPWSGKLNILVGYVYQRLYQDTLNGCHGVVS